MTHEQDQSIRHIVAVFTILGTIAIIILLAVIVIPILPWPPGPTPKPVICMTNLQQLSMALNIYAQDYGGIYPSTTSVWGKLDVPKAILQCPSDHTGNGYGYNAALAGRRTDDPSLPTPQLLPMVADCANATHLLTTGRDFDYRHGKKVIVGYVDGTVQMLPPGTVILLPLPGTATSGGSTP